MTIELHDPSDREFSPLPSGTPAVPLGEDPHPVAQHEDMNDGRRRSFALESHGGYLRNVTGTVAYRDDEAQTYMVRDDDGTMLRVPIRDIRSITWPVDPGAVA